MLISTLDLIKSRVRKLNLSKREAYSKIPNLTQNTAFSFYGYEFYHFSAYVQKSLSL